MSYQLRIARPASDLERVISMYCAGVELRVIGRFENHDGFDGVMLGTPGLDYHFEFTHCQNHPIAPAPTAEDLTVFYVPALAEWRRACDNMLTAGFKPVAALNPYWNVQGRTFEDPDGYRVVLQNAAWTPC